jgi:hypothetical protein
MGCAAALLAAPAAGAKVPAGSKTVSFEGLAATLSWSAGQYTTAEKPRLAVSQDGTQLFDKDLTKVCDLCTGLADPKHDIAIRDLESNAVPVVMVDLYSGGAHCCWSTVFARVPAGEPSAYDISSMTWGNSGYTLKQLDGDGIVEFVSSDDRFAYVFAPYVASWRPVQIWNYRSGKMVDRTRHFLARVRADLHAIDKALPDARKFGEARGLIAARVADMYLLGLGSGVDRYLNKALARGDLNGISGYPKGRKYIAALKKFLRKTGYIR